MKRYIYLFRHGQTVDNNNSIFSGWRDSKLNKIGRDSAEIVALRLKGKKINVAFQTKLSRSKETLKIILKYHPECKKIITDDRMIERCYGKLQGRSHYDFVKKNNVELYDKYHRSYNIPPPKGESVKMVEKRVRDFIKDLLKFMKKEKVNVGISAHGNSIRPFRRYFEKLSVKEMMLYYNDYDACWIYSVEC